MWAAFSSNNPPWVNIHYQPPYKASPVSTQQILFSPVYVNSPKLDPRHVGEQVIVTFISLFISIKLAVMMRSDRRAGEPQSSLKTAPGGSSNRSEYQSRRLTGRVGNDRPSHKQLVRRLRSIVREWETVFRSHYSGGGGRGGRGGDTAR